VLHPTIQRVAGEQAYTLDPIRLLTASGVAQQQWPGSAIDGGASCACVAGLLTSAYDCLWW